MQTDYFKKCTLEQIQFLKKLYMLYGLNIIPPMYETVFEKEYEKLKFNPLHGANQLNVMFPDWFDLKDKSNWESRHFTQKFIDDISEWENLSEEDQRRISRNP